MVLSDSAKVVTTSTVIMLRNINNYQLHFRSWNISQERRRALSDQFVVNH